MLEIKHMKHIDPLRKKQTTKVDTKVSCEAIKMEPKDARRQQRQPKWLQSVHPPNDAEPSTTSQSAEEQSRSRDESILVPLVSRWPTAQRAEADRRSALSGAATQTGPGLGPAGAAGTCAAGNTHPQLGKGALLWFWWKWGGERRRGRRERFNVTHEPWKLGGLVWNRYLDFIETECACVSCSEASNVLLVFDWL